MRLWMMPLLGSMVCASAANAVTVFSDTFDSENLGNGRLYYNSFSQFDVTTGDIDLIRNNDYGIGCAGGSGSCVDLNGGQTGALTSKSSFAYNAGDVVTLSAQFSGNQRIPGLASFFFLALMDENGNVAGTGQGTVDYDAGFATYTASFTAVAAGRVFAQLGSATRGVYGPIVDNVTLDVSSSAVPEPATWALSIIGFGAIGSSLRRANRRTTTRFA